MTIEQIDALLADKSDDKQEINDWKFGIELEYGGYDTQISYDANDQENLIETIKTDGSVAGDGTEYNLKPISFKDMKNNKKIVRAIESFCFKVANKNCTLSPTAGMHIHFSWGDEYASPEVGRTLGDLLFEASRVIFSSDWNRGLKNPPRSLYPDKKLTKMIEEFEFKDTEIEENHFPDWELAYRKKMYEAFQLIYSTANRNGNESYGLGTNCTRGYTRHKTIELRCWRTSYDYREIIARAFIARFFLRYALRLQLYKNHEHYETLLKMPTIWEMINQEENAQLKQMFEYLAFNNKNKHYTGLPAHALLTKLCLSDNALAGEIKRRSEMFEKAMRKNTVQRRAKDLFERIIDLKEGE